MLELDDNEIQLLLGLLAQLIDLDDLSEITLSYDELDLITEIKEQLN